MSSKRMFYVLCICAALLTVLGISGVVFGNGLLQKSSKQLTDLKLETSVIDEQQNSLVQANRDIEKYADLEKIAMTVVPQDKDQARTVREIVKFADETGVPIKSISFPASDLGTIVAAPQATTPADSTDTTSTPAKPAAPPVSQVTAVDGIKGLYQMEISIQNDKDSQVRYQSLINFLKKLEQNRRTSQVTNVNISPDPKNRNLMTYTMTISVYIKP